jgi:thiol-disulfide isomerase/thioredoxin
MSGRGSRNASRVSNAAKNSAKKMANSIANRVSGATENIVIVVLLIVLVILVVYYVRQNNEKFTERPTIYFFHVDWCPHCKTALPKVAEFKKKNNDVNVVEVDCDKDKELAKKFNVKAYPTVYLVKGEEKIELSDGVSVKSLTDLVKNN